MVKVGIKKVPDGKGKTKKLTPLEDAFHLVGFLQVELEGKKIGATILKKHKSEDYKIQFAFESLGIHTTLREEEIEPVFEALEAGLKDFPDKESLTIHLSSFAGDHQRQEEFKKLFDGDLTPQLQLLLMGERKRTKELTEAGIRKAKSLRLYCSYTIAPGEDKNSDKVELGLGKLETWWHKFTGEYEEVHAQKIETLIRNAFTEGFQQWEQFLSNKLGLLIRPLTAEEIWSGLWRRFNSTVPRPIPQMLILDSKGVREEINSQIHPLSLLQESESAVPQAQKSWVRIKDKYVGVLVFAEKPGGWKDKQSQLRYLWKALAEEKVIDTEIICQITLGNQRMLKDKMSSLTKQANVTAKLASEKDAVDVNAGLRAQKTIEAQKALYSGEVPLKLATVFLVHRDTPNQLDEACNYFQSLFKRPAWIIRETEYPWKIWVETFPLVWEKILTKPFERRSIYLSGEAPGLMPLVRTRSFDKKGFELISSEGGTPVHLDLFNQHRNLGVFGTTRSGKSVLISGILIQALARGLPISAIDFPRGDGTGTFSDLCEFLEEPYFDISKESSNLFEPPDLRGLDSKLQAERLLDYQEFLLEVLLNMVIGSRQSEINPDSIRSILTLALEKFFKDEQIHQRYGEAFIAGFGSPEWKGMPTLEDFVGFCSLERLQLLSPSPEIVSALEFTKLRLRFWLASRVGKAVSRPTSFRSDAQFLVVALRNLSNQEDAALLAMTVYLAALRRSLASRASIFFLDEAPILFEYDALAGLVAKLCANGAKSGIRVIISAQEPNTIAQSSSGAKVFANLSSRLVGRLQPSAVEAFINILKYPIEIIRNNATESFFPRKEGMYSQWLLDDNGLYTVCRYYPSFPLLAAVANNPEETAARKEALARHGNKLVALAEFSKEYVISLRS